LQHLAERVAAGDLAGAATAAATVAVGVPIVIVEKAGEVAKSIVQKIKDFFKR
jgi:hypothetical protein